MSKEIKYQLRDLNNKLVGYEKWYHGSYNNEQGYYVAEPCWLYSVDNKNWTPNYIPHRYKYEFTGLLDKDGKEIYEGHILQDCDTPQWKYSVIWSISGRWGMKTVKDDFHVEMFRRNEHRDYEYEIIGHIAEESHDSAKV